MRVEQEVCEMKCPFCGSSQTITIDSRSLGTSRHRRRECLACSRRFSTEEIVTSTKQYKHRRK